jgi:hypothetical protein
MADLPRFNGQDRRTAEGAGSSSAVLEMSSSLASMLKHQATSLSDGARAELAEGAFPADVRV